LRAAPNSYDGTNAHDKNYRHPTTHSLQQINEAATGESAQNPQDLPIVMRIVFGASEVLKEV
jgi:hypothetical protein